jgi:hypothetical protein
VQYNRADGAPGAPFVGLPSGAFCMSAPIQLNDEDVAYLLTLLRNATLPMTTQQLIDALRRQAGQSRG